MEQETKNINLNLHPKQWEIWEAGEKYRFRVLVAGRRFGKSTLALNELLIYALSHNNSYLWMVAPSYRQAKMIAWRKLKEMITKDLKPIYNESELSVVLPNGSRLELKGADNEESLLGVGLDGLVIDEFASIYDNWSVWHEILRPMLADKKGWCLFIGTPKGKDAFWELFMRGERGEDNWKSWQLKTEDNPYIELSEIEDAKANTPGRYFRQEYEASFEDFTGLIWPEYNEKQHLVDDHFVQGVYPKIGAIDTAVTGTTGALKAYIDEDGVIVVYSEYYESNVRVDEVCESIREDGVSWIIDPESKKKQATRRGEQEFSLYDEYVDHGISAENAQKDVHAGINRVAEYLKNGKIRIFKSCTNLVHEIERYHWSESKETAYGETQPKPFKKLDHLNDCLRYLCMTRPSETDISYKKPIHSLSPLARMENAKRRRGAW